MPTLVYSVNRTPERPFQTARDVTVITQQEIERRNPRTLPEILLDHGVFLRQSMYSNSRVYLRGFNGKELLVLVDGVQANNAINNFDLNLLDVHTIERVEIVQGVGSVLGSEALGGIINVITRQGPAMGAQGALRTRAVSRVASTSKNGYAEAAGRTERLRYRLGGGYTDTDDLEAGTGLGVEQWTGYIERGASGGLDFFATPERTVSASARTHALIDPPRRQRYTSGSYLKWVEPARENAYSLRYADVSGYGWADAMQVTAYGSQLRTGSNYIRTSTPTVHTGSPNQSNKVGAGLELSKLFGTSNRLLYGADASVETVHSWTNDTATTTGAVTWKRGQFTDGATLRTMAA
jgi:outer membrane receptor protein involved in Fe transport